ncbi:MAG: hypothetical protein JW875_08885 [Spirochaetales bacterium]|nr:hypothetical protein [Spirochaetales bacterium]
MKKALWLIAALVLALVLVTGCEQESIEISKLPQGSDNFDFEGKTLVQLIPTYGNAITKFSIAGASTTSSTIYLTQETGTFVFGEDGNYTYSSTETYTPAADGQYVDGVVPGVSYSTEYYLSGFAGKTISTYVTTGTWYQYKDKKSDATDVTKILMTDSVTTTSTYTPDNFASSVVIRTYAAGTTSTTISNQYVGDPSGLTYSYGGETADGRDVWMIGGEAYVEQE